MSINKFQEIEQDIWGRRLGWAKKKIIKETWQVKSVPSGDGRDKKGRAEASGEGSSDTRLNKQGDKTYTLEEKERDGAAKETREREWKRQLKMETSVCVCVKEREVPFCLFKEIYIRPWKTRLYRWMVHFSRTHRRAFFFVCLFLVIFISSFLFYSFLDERTETTMKETKKRKAENYKYPVCLRLLRLLMKWTVCTTHCPHFLVFLLWFFCCLFT